MNHEEDIASRTKKLIQDYVDNHWYSTQSACYFSSIGVHLSRTAPETRVALTNGLGEFLRQNPVVRVVQYPGVSQKIGAIPLSAPLPEDIKTLFLQGRSTASYSNRNIYVQDFWNAFIRPIEGSVRNIVVDDANRFTIHDSPMSPENGAVYQIEPQDLATSFPSHSISDKVSAIHSAIDTWLQKHSLDRGIFLCTKLQRRDFPSDSKLARLLKAVEGFSPDDLARIKIPLDILVDLASKK